MTCSSLGRIANAGACDGEMLKLKGPRTQYYVSNRAGSPEVCRQPTIRPRVGGAAHAENAGRSASSAAHEQQERKCKHAQPRLGNSTECSRRRRELGQIRAVNDEVVGAVDHSIPVEI